MQNIDILNGKPFKDLNLKSKINQLELSSATQVSTIPYATWANPGTTERVLLLTEKQVAAESLYSTVDAIVNLTSNITGAQTFTFKLYLGAEVVATSVVSVPDALNTLFSVRLKGTITYSRLNGTDLEYVANLTATPISTSATASVSTITVVNTQNAAVTYDDLENDFNTKLSCTASVGTATTAITCLGGRATFDNKN